MASTGISFWSCAASCADQKEREVVGLYRGNTPLLVSRPWCAPACSPVLQIATRKLFPVLSSLISVADYHQHEGAWYGEIATDWKAVAALSGISRNTITASLQDLMRAGFIHYEPAWGRVTPALIRVLPYNAKTGLRVFQIEASWLRAYILRVEPRLALFSAEAEGKSVEFKQLTPNRKLSSVRVRVMGAPISIPKSTHNEPNHWAHDIPKVEGNEEMLQKLKGVAGLEDVFTLASGLAPDIKPLPMSPAAGLIQVLPKDDWRAAAWSQDGVKVVVVDEELPPAPGDHGVLATWEVAAEDQAEKVEIEAEQQAADASRAQTQGSTGYTNDTQKSHQNDSNDYTVLGTSPNGGLMARPGAGAPAAPPAAAPPAANALFLRPASRRQLLPGQVVDLYRARGNRVSEATRRGMTVKEVSCIETYERLIGVPFCEQDVQFLEHALTITTHACVLRGIKDASRWPKDNPGFYTVRDGMKQVLNYIVSNRVLNSKSRGSKRVTQSGMDDGLQKKIRARRQGKGVPSKEPVVSPESPIVSPEASTVSPGSGIVSEKTPIVSPEPTRQEQPS
jgi:hypothetical protein